LTKQGGFNRQNPEKREERKFGGIFPITVDRLKNTDSGEHSEYNGVKIHSFVFVGMLIEWRKAKSHMLLFLHDTTGCVTLYLTKNPNEDIPPVLKDVNLA
jgi:hypothetical protein